MANRVSKNLFRLLSIGLGDSLLSQLICLIHSVHSHFTEDIFSYPVVYGRTVGPSVRLPDLIKFRFASIRVARSGSACPN